MSPEVDAIRRACEAVLEFFFADSPPKAQEIDPVAASFQTESDRVVVLGVEGSWRGNLVLMFPSSGRAPLAHAFIGGDLGLPIEDMIDDVLVELGNQIAARACRELESLKLGSSDLTPPSLISAEGPMDLAWNLRKASVLKLEPYLEIAIGLAPGPRRKEAALPSKP